jgi:hypothetical protein
MGYTAVKDEIQQFISLRIFFRRFPGNRKTAGAIAATAASKPFREKSS